MMEDHHQLPPKNQQQSSARGNRVFILQYSPQMSKSKKKHYTDTSNPKQKVSYLINEQRNSKQGRSNNEFSHRSNLDRLTALISKSRSNNSSVGDSGCEKLVKVLDRVLKIKCLKAQALQKLKRYTMLCSSTNYQLFVESKHTKYLSKQKSISPLAKINEYQALELSLKSSQFSLGLNKNIEQKSITFRNRDSRQFNQSISRYLQQSNQGFKLKNRQYIATCQTLKSQKQLNQSINPVGQSSIIQLKMLKSSTPNTKMQEPFENKLLFIDAQEQFLHLCHLKSQQLQNSSLPNPIDVIQIANLSQIKGQARQYTKPKPDFALPTSIIRNSDLPQNVNKNKMKKDKQRQILSSKQIADRMLYGQNTQQAVVAKKKMAEIKIEKNKKRVSSLPKIIFTYLSQQKDMLSKFASPKPQRCVQVQLKDKSPLINIKKPSRNEQKMKIQIQSTFGSTRDLGNPYQCPIPQFQSSPIIQKRPALKFPPQKVISKRPLIVNSINPNSNNNDYYAQTNYKLQKGEGRTNRQPRERVLTQVPHFGTGIEYVGVEGNAQIECCLLQKNTRSKSLNNMLIGYWI